MCGASTSSLRGRAWMTSSSAFLQQCVGVRRWGLLAEPRSVGITASSLTLQHLQAPGGEIAGRTLRNHCHSNSFVCAGRAQCGSLFLQPSCSGQAQGGVSHCPAASIAPFKGP